MIIPEIMTNQSATMAKYRSKLIEIQATQWFPGIKIEGVTTDDGTVHYSRDKTYYYITKGDLRPTKW